MNPIKVCSQIGLCQSDSNKKSEPGIASVLDKDASVSGGMERDDPGCRVCQMAVVWAQNQLRQNRTREQIDSYLNQLCERLPSPNGESLVDCDSLSSMPTVSFTIADKIFDLTPEDVCDSSPDFSSSLPFCTTHPIFSNLSCLYS
jgi:phytepsin